MPEIAHAEAMARACKIGVALPENGAEVEKLREQSGAPLTTLMNAENALADVDNAGITADSCSMSARARHR